MNFNTFSYLFKEGWKNVLKNKKTTVASLIITCFTMIICGIFFIAMENVENISDKIAEQQGMEVFLFELDDEGTKRVEQEINQIEGIREVTYTSKDQALEKAKEMFKDNPEMIAGYDEENKLPASFVVMLSDLDKSESIKQQIRQIEGVDSITIKDKVIQVSSYISKAVKIVTTIILIFSIIGSILIISNTIKITVHSRRKEISIMKYVGATDGFIRVPFLVQGALTGFFAAVISTIIVALVYKFAAGFSESVPNSLTTIPFNDMLRTLILIFLSMGIGIGTIGSYISMKKYLKV